MNFFILLTAVLSQLGGSFADRFVSISMFYVLIFANIFTIPESTPQGSVCGTTSVVKVCSAVINL